MKQLKIEVPQGYEIDKEKSTFEKIVFKELKKELPKTFEELKEIEGYYISANCQILYSSGNLKGIAMNNFATKEQAKASLALAQLSQLREIYRQGWVPDWSDREENKYCIFFQSNKIKTVCYINSCEFLSFKDEETRDLFLENFRNLIEQAKPLMS